MRPKQASPGAWGQCIVSLSLRLSFSPWFVPQIEAKGFDLSLDAEDRKGVTGVVSRERPGPPKYLETL